MRPAKEHRRAERAHLGSLRYAIRNGLYDMAFRELMWAHQQSVAADIKEAIMQEDKAKKKAAATTSPAWNRNRMNETHRKGKRGAKKVARRASRRAGKLAADA